MNPKRRSNRLQIISLFILLVLALAALGWARGSVQADEGVTPDVPPDFKINLSPLPLPDRYIVVFDEAALFSAQSQAAGLSTAALAAQMVAEAGGQLHYTYEAALQGFAATLSPEAAATIAANPVVSYLEPDLEVGIVTTQTPATWGLDRIDQRNLPLDNRYTYGNNGAGVHVYIIDTGIRASHVEFSGRIGNGYTSINDGNGTNDCHGHGTHVGGTVGGATWGVAKGVTLHPVRVLSCSGSGSTSGVIAGIDWVTAHRLNPAVANMSLGGGASSALDTAVRNSVNAGVVHVVAAGNESGNACNGSPARAPEAVTVGASTSADARASFSNYGSCLDIFAPGQNITSAVNTSNTATATWSGTSMASPHVAGAAALYRAANPSALPAVVVNALINNASTNKLSNVGSGSPNRLLYTTGLDGPTPTPTPTRTPGPSPTPTRTPTLTPTPAPGSCTNRVLNGDYEAGAQSWTQTSTRGYTLICNTATCGASLNPHGGNYAVWLGGADNEDARVSQTGIALPAGQTAVLTFWQRLESQDYCGYDSGYVKVTANGVTKTLNKYDLCYSKVTNGWVKRSLDLSSYAGKTIRLMFQLVSDYSLISNFFVDDVAITGGSHCTGSDALDAIESSDEAEGEPAPALPKPEAPADLPGVSQR
jgi:subtilisin family serine protease